MRKFSPFYYFAKTVASWAVHGVTRTNWEGLENLPKNGGYVVAANHVTEFDALTLMHPLVDNEIPVRVMAKASLFKVPVLGWIMRQAGQVPVYRGTSHAQDALVAAKEALAGGEVIAIFPEGTLTRDPECWPMTPKTGVGRLALAGPEPVIPCAQWGGHQVLGRYSRVPHLLGRKDVTVKFGKPVFVDDLRDWDDQVAAAREAANRVIDAITALLAEVRNEVPPALRYDPKVHGELSKEALGRVWPKQAEKFKYSIKN
ncbi:hypothetical protein BK816_02995 [Boudabousia tangfeifanii]|uniref:Phospholipid/glycerol acyltransferase domain-containing protein n=1 Tax=Boudabousia tangfeifanii TaxID=1912795 RepID=A0A1D9MJK1_9ACTO|nr:lysophospholipid acyltransferase family protein [Boudabousia tangfeifanii]AOZ72388.1 hypothetical protein BK816_02995 [Boudabousia tangfeifanii]